MKRRRITLLIFIIFINTIFSSGCWNYREIDRLAIVAGVAIDQGKSSQFEMTVEVISISGGTDSKMTSITISAEGRTMFEAARNIISISGKRLYWPHTKVIIISNQIAKEGIRKVIDWYNRDSETREEVNILISASETAKEILTGQELLEDVMSYTLDDILNNQCSLNKAPVSDMLKVDKELQSKGISTVIPTVRLINMEGKIVPQILGCAIIKKDKLVGFLSAEDTKYLVLIKNEVKGGLWVEVVQRNEIDSLITLEVFKSKTKVSPVVSEKDIRMKIDIETTVSIDEVEGPTDIEDEENIRKIKQNAENLLIAKCKDLIKKIQKEYDTDIFGFGAKLHQDNVKAWNSVSDDWHELFMNLEVDIDVTVNIKNTALLSKNLKIEE